MRIVRLFDCSTVRLPGASRSGFTILELLVASLLLSMLVTMLTMMFNQSSIAWRTGVSGVNELEETREQLGGYHDVLDDVLPGLAQNNVQGGSSDNRNLDYRTVSVFRNWNGSGQLSKSVPSQQCSGRLFDRINWGDANLSQVSIGSAQKGQVISNLKQPTTGTSRGGYIVGVRSAGPDRKMDTEDDNINTFPEDID